MEVKTLNDELESMVCWMDMDIYEKKKRKELWPIYKFRINLIMMQLYEIRVAAMHGDSKG